LKIYNNISLRKYNTFGFGYKVDRLISIETEEEAISILKDQKLADNPLLVLGGGSNILFISDFKGTILHPDMEGIRIDEQDQDHAIISAGAGVNWDKLVEWTVYKGFSGLENLSLIPGMVGASPVQNIGAYGVEARDTIEKVKAICIKDGTMRVFSNTDCQFGYRKSIFKGEHKGKYVITSVQFRLSKKPLVRLDYGSLNDEIKKLGEVSLKNIRHSVINIRRSKLPDPEITGNAGSFFKNPVVSNVVAEDLKKNYPDMPLYEGHSGAFKLAAGWLIDKCGWKGKRIGDAGVHDKQALVLVNYGKSSGREIFDLSEKIRESVIEKFGVELEREVEVVGSI
jgi:UDP-N-acetylmuramate dehydrogenase